MDEKLVNFWRALSMLCGWSYVLCWSLSFYPQPLLNLRRKSTHGLTADFPFLNLFGFISYTISTSCFLFSPRIRSQYAHRHPAAPEPTVRVNDFAFAAHALVMVALTYSMLFKSIWGFDVPRTQRTSTPVRCLVLASAVFVIASILRAAWNEHHHLESHVPATTYWTWIDVIYVFSSMKLLATLVKYTPQVLLNYSRKSTKGWSIHQILFDFAGGVLSLSQLFIDASFQGDWSGITGNPAKFGLSNISMAFDVIFIVQHYVLYRGSTGVDGMEGGDGGKRREDDGSDQPLLEDRARDSDGVVDRGNT